MSFWKGNVPQLLRIFPYSAAQLTANDQYKRLLAGGASRRHGGSSGSSAEQVSARMSAGKKVDGQTSTFTPATTGPKITSVASYCREQGQPPRKYCVAHQAAMSGSLPSHMLQTPQEAQAVWLRMSRLL